VFSPAFIILSLFSNKVNWATTTSQLNFFALRLLLDYTSTLIIMSVSITADTPAVPATNQADVSLGSKGRMPEFSLAGKVVLVSGAARGLGLTQAEALLEAGAKVYGLDRLEEPVSNLGLTPCSWRILSNHAGR
jgi:hypothetical protein